MVVVAVVVKRRLGIGEAAVCVDHHRAEGRLRQADCPDVAAVT